MTLRFALIGQPVAQSLSPVIHRAFAAAAEIDLDYQRMEVSAADLAATVAAFFADGGAGLNVTVPHKQAVLALADVVAPSAAAAGAANTLVRAADGAIHAHNTDGLGLVTDLQRLAWPVAGARVLLLGAGGAARGALPALLAAGVADVLLANRSPAAADALVAQCADPRITVAPASLPAPLALVVNATAAGLHGALPPAPAGAIGPGSHCYDMVYGPAAAGWQAHCQASGAAGHSDGLGMLVAQAAAAFALWHGRQPALAPVLAQLRLEAAGRG